MRNTPSYKNSSEKLNNIKKIMVGYSSVEPESSYHVISNLNWLRYTSRIKKIVNMLPRKSKVLEIGCGWGQVSAMLKILRPDLKVVGSDIEKSDAWKKLKPYGCRYVECDAKDLCFDDEFHAVVSFGVMEHINNDEKFLGGVFRVLRNGGHNFIFDLPNKYGFSEVVVGRVLGFVGGKKFYRHEVRYRKDKVKQLLLKCGFININIKNEFLIPAQASRINKKLGEFFNKHYLFLNNVDKFLIKTPLATISQTLSIHCRKP